MRILLITLVTMGGLVLALEFTLADFCRTKKRVRREVEIEFVIPEEIRKEASTGKGLRRPVIRRVPDPARARQARDAAWRLFAAPLTLALRRLT